MNRAAGTALAAALTCAAAAALIAVDAATTSEPRPAPSRVYSSCLAADTLPVPAGGDPCDEGR
ncbi:hypothetical protein [Streptomyces sp. JB150]|uniref:hypothetical protein n=1 Tax=Streptomyces sp. JB150 TaxID=2714844 RepID=UPI001408244C|nr:hypothetical protein [Streptomyces sp. JB150]QIJ60640.1 hypothetical protein G7Z13_00235 [Streptomyces sp. JB150]